MKLLFLAGADSMHSVRWISYFVNAGEDTTWISFGKPLPEAMVLTERTAFQHLPLTKGLAGLIGLPRALWQVYRTIRRVRPDVLHVHYAGLYGLVGALLGFRPYVLSVWGSDVLVFPSTVLKKAITRFILKSADLITLDGYNTKAAVMRLGVPHEKIQFVQFGVDAKVFAPSRNNEPNTVISIRSLEPVYDIRTLVESIPAVMAKVPQATFIIAGDGSEKESLTRLAGDLGIADHVRFVGRIRHDELPSFYNRASVYVSTSLSDSGLSMSTAEAMASGLPVIVTDTSDNLHWVQDAATASAQAGGFVIPVRNPALLSEKIIYLLTHDTERRTFGDNNRKTVEDRNSYLGEMARMHEFYRKLLS
jgi:glycosyltransferase involved in cell wall biosynthesis